MQPEHIALKTPCCSECKSSHYVIPIIYGQPTEELLQRWRKKEVELAGALVMSALQPQWTCTRCKIFVN